MAENRQIDRRQFLTALAGGGVAGLFVMGSGSTGPAGSNANVGPGTANKLAKFLSANMIGDSALSDDGSNITSTESINPATDNALDIGTAGKKWRIINAGLLGILNSGATTRVAPDIHGDGSSIYIEANNDAIRFRPRGVDNNTNAIQISQNTQGFLGPIADDNLIDLGASTLRYQNLYLGTALRILAASGDSQPTAKISGSELDLGPGGSTATDNYLKRIAANSLEMNAGLRPSTDNARDLGSETLRYGSVYGVNLRGKLYSGSGDLIMQFGAVGGGGGSLHFDGTTWFPSADNAQDWGGSGNRWRTGIFAGQLKARGKNVLVLDGQSMTQSSHTVSNADTDIATYSLGANSYTRVIVRITGYVSFVTLSTNQVINLKILNGTTQVGNTMVVDAAVSATSSVPFTLEAVFVQTGAATIHFTEGAAAADANTTVFINSIVVMAES